MSVSPVTPAHPPTLPHSCNGSEGSATDGAGGELHVNICSHRLPGLKQIHYISLVPPSPPKPIQKLYLCLGSRGLQGSPGRSRRGEIVNEGKLGKGVSVREAGGWLTLAHNGFMAPEWEEASEWTFPIAGLWNTNNEASRRVFLHLIDYRLYQQHLLLRSHRLSFTWTLHWLQEYIYFILATTEMFAALHIGPLSKYTVQILWHLHFPFGGSDHKRKVCYLFC